MKSLRSILIVDDDPVSRLLSKKTVQALPLNNIRTYEASNGQEALDVINNIYTINLTLPSLILLDLNMNIMGGFEFIEVFEHSNFQKKEMVHICNRYGFQ